MDSAPLPMAEGIPPLDLVEPGGGADLARVLDASANRAREGLRVVEDYVRFALDDPGLTRRLKEVRHRLAEAERGLDACLLIDSRDTREDVGTHIMTMSERIRENPRAVLAANFKRIAEALRSLEEYSKLVDVWLAGRFEVLRYDIYTIEKMTMTAVAAHRSLGEARLMVLIGGLRTLGDLTWVVEEAIAGGADVIQYREKGVPDRELLRRAREVRILTARARIPMIMNDRPDLARLAGCDGVHLGQEDVSVRDARRVLSSAAQVGVSTHDRAQLDAAILAGASYLGVGPVFPSPTKEFSEPELAGLSFVRLAAEIDRPALVRHRRDQRGERGLGSWKRERRESPSAGRSCGPRALAAPSHGSRPGWLASTSIPIRIASPTRVKSSAFLKVRRRSAIESPRGEISMRIPIGRLRQISHRQGFFTFIERRRRRERWFKESIVLTTCLAIVFIVRAFPWGRYMTSEIPSTARQAVRQMVGLKQPGPRSRIPGGGSARRGSRIPGRE